MDFKSVLSALSLVAAVGGVGSVAIAADGSSTTIVGLALDAGSVGLIKTDGRNVYRQSEDGGGWVRLSLPDSATSGRITAVAASGPADATLYVSGPGIGVLRSSDAGRTWSAKRNGLPSDDVVALTVHADQPDTVYAYLSGKGIFRSEDGGDHWRLMDAGPRTSILQFVHSNMPGSMQTGWLFAATAKGVARSMDCFCGWRDAGALGRAVMAVAYDPRQPSRVYAATSEGLFASDNGGEQWSALSSPRNLTSVIATPRGELLAGDSAGKLFRSADRGVSWRAIDG